MKYLRYMAAMASIAFATSAESTVVPTSYEAGHFFATPELQNGQRLRLMVDTGGGGAAGMYWLSAAAAKRAGLTPRICKTGEQSATVADLPRFKAGSAIPAPGKGACGEALLIQPVTAYDDGQLGGAYLSRGIWTFDYPAQRLTSEGHDWKPDPQAHKLSLGFQRDDGDLTTGFPGITVTVDGESLYMLLDTGAQSHPTPEAAKISGTPMVRGEGVASYIATSVLERWHKAHPEWRVVEHADHQVAAKPLERIIEVPLVSIAGWNVGPVWFTEQPDAAYQQYMAQWMDKPSKGAIGGNVFDHFSMTIDYAGSAAWLRCVRGCATAQAGSNTNLQ